MLLSTLVVLVPAVFLLGASSPLFIRLQANTAADAGKVSGTVYAVSTAGGISATFLCGFYLIPAIGLQNTLLLFGALLFFVNAIIFKSALWWEILVLLLAFYMHFQLWQMRQDRLLESDGVMGQIEVRDEVRENKRVRVLAINQIVQSEMDLDTKKSVSPYLNLVDELLPQAHDESSEALVLGLGGGLSAGLLQRKGYDVTGVEFDARILKAAKSFFFLSEKVKTEEEDARVFLNKCRQKFDLVMVDVFRAEEQPSHVFTLESLNALKTNLTDSALVCISWHGYLEGGRGEGTQVLLNTLKAAGYHTKVCTNSANEDNRNLIIIASTQSLKPFPHELNLAASTILALNTDDQPQLERSNALANKSWRSLYLRYYQQKK
jgi:spermidine synthase